MSKAMKAWMEMIHTWRKISCAAMVMAPKPVTIDVAVRMTTMDDTFRRDSDRPLCKGQIDTYTTVEKYAQTASDSHPLAYCMQYSAWLAKCTILVMQLQLAMQHMQEHHAYNTKPPCTQANHFQHVQTDITAL